MTFVRARDRVAAEADVELDGVAAGEAELNPVVLGIGLGARF